MNLHEAQSRKNEMFQIFFYIYCLYQGILNLAYSYFINTLTNSIKYFHKLAVTKYFDRLIILDYVGPINLTESTYSYK